MLSSTASKPSIKDLTENLTAAVVIQQAVFYFQKDYFSIRAKAACGTYTTAVNTDVLTAGCSVGHRGVEGRSTTDDEMDTPGQVSAAPNPTSGIVNLNLEKMGKINDLRLFSAEGKLLENITIEDTTYALDLSGRPSGIYFVQCTPENGVPQMIRVIRE